MLAKIFIATFLCSVELTSSEYWGCSDLAWQPPCMKVDIDDSGAGPSKMKMEVLLVSENGRHRHAFYFFREIKYKQVAAGHLELENGLDKLGFLFDFHRDVVSPMDTLDDVNTTLAQFVNSTLLPAILPKDCLKVLGMTVCQTQGGFRGWSFFSPELRLLQWDRTYTLFVLWVSQGGRNTGACQYPKKYFGCWEDGSGCMLISIESKTALRMEIMIGSGATTFFVVLPNVEFIFASYYFLLDFNSGESTENTMLSFETESSVALVGNLRDIAEKLKSLLNFGGISARILGGSLLRNQIDLIGIHLTEGTVDWLVHAQSKGVVVGEKTKAFFHPSNHAGQSSKVAGGSVEPLRLSSKTGSTVSQPENKGERVGMVGAGMLSLLALSLL